MSSTGAKALRDASSDRSPSGSVLGAKTSVNRKSTSSSVEPKTRGGGSAPRYAFADLHREVFSLSSTFWRGAHRHHVVGLVADLTRQPSPNLIVLGKKTVPEPADVRFPISALGHCGEVKRAVQVVERCESLPPIPALLNLATVSPETCFRNSCRKWIETCSAILEILSL